MSKIEEPSNSRKRDDHKVKIGNEKQHEIYLSAKAKLQMVQSKKVIKEYQSRPQRQKRRGKRDELEQYTQVLQTIRKEQKLAYLKTKISNYLPPDTP